MNSCRQDNRARDFLAAGTFLLAQGVFICLAFYLSAALPLLALAMAGLVCLLHGPGLRPTPVMVCFCLYVLYLLACNAFFFPHVSQMALLRQTLFPFLGGIALFHLLGERVARFPLSFAFWMTIMTLVHGLLSGPEGMLTEGGRLRIAFNHPNGLSFAYGIAAISCFYCLLSGSGRGTLRRSLPRLVLLWEKTLRRPWMIFAMLLVCALGLLWTQSRTSVYAVAIVCAGLGAGALAGRYGKRAAGALILILAVSGWGMAQLPVLNESPAVSRMLSVIKNPGQDPTLRTRLPGWESALQTWRSSPWIGHGPESFAPKHRRYVEENYERLVADLGEGWVRGDTLPMANAHNLYLMTLAERGVLGMALLLAVFAACAYTALVRKRGGLVVSVLAFYLITGIFEGMLYGGRAAAVSTTMFGLLAGYLAVSDNKSCKTGAGSPELPCRGGRSCI